MTQQKLPVPEDFARSVIDVAVADEMSESFLAYSLSVITSRAIPDVRDGLKPVQRRILYAMLNMGIRPDGPHRKCARVVGETMGNFHPHGDSAIYDALVRLGQDFSKNLPLIDPQGNFGSLDASAAAPRYTECRLDNAAMALLGEIDEQTVPFHPTYDGESNEPEYLPGAVPNLLVNGTTGIAVGMATNMAPHNFVEVAEVIELVLTQRRPKPTVEEMMRLLPGPDFPSGGLILDEGLDEIYETGKGPVVMRAKAHIEQLTKKRQGIIVTELPYLVGAERVIERIKKLLVDDKLPGVAAVTNYSDRHHGLRIQIDCEIGVNPQAVLAQLYRVTPLEERFNVNNVALVDGVPTTLGLFDLCKHYIAHRLEIIQNRTRYRLGRAQARLHIVEGLLIALDNIDRVIEIIRTSETVPEARETLCVEFSLSEIQATHILDMQLRRLVGLERLKLIDERDSLMSTIQGYEKLLASDRRQRSTLLKELKDLVEAFGRPRRTEIIDSSSLEKFSTEDILGEQPSEEITEEPCLITVTTSATIGRAPLVDERRFKPGRHDLIIQSFETTTATMLAAITSSGRVLQLGAHHVGDAQTRSRGSDIGKLFGTNRAEKILTVIAHSPADSGADNGAGAGSGAAAAGADTEDPIMLVTSKGVAKRVSHDELINTKSGSTIINLKDDDSLAAAFTCPTRADIAIVSSDAQILRTASDNISIQGRGAGGVAGMKLKGDAVVVAADIIDDALFDCTVICVSSDAEAKATPIDEIAPKGRGGGGVRLMRLKPSQFISQVYIGTLESLWVLMSTDDDLTKLDPTPVPFEIEPTKRDLAATDTERQILAIAQIR